MNAVHSSLADSGLVRATDGRILGGVCAGLARRYDFDVMAVRIVVAVAMVILPGSPLVLYPLMWLAMPGEDVVRRERPSWTWTSRRSGPQDTIG